MLFYAKLVNLRFISVILQLLHVKNTQEFCKITHYKFLQCSIGQFFLC